MCQGEEISRQAVSSWSPRRKKPLCLSSTLGTRELSFCLSSLSGRRVSCGAGIGWCDDWALMGRVSSVTRVRQEVWTVLMFSDFARCQSSQPTLLWSFCSVFFSFPRAELPCLPVLSCQADNSIKKFQNTTDYVKHARIFLSKSLFKKSLSLFIPHFKFKALMCCDRSASVLGGSPWRFLILISFMFWNKL